MWWWGGIHITVMILSLNDLPQIREVVKLKNELKKPAGVLNVLQGVYTGQAVEGLLDTMPCDL